MPTKYLLLSHLRTLPADDEGWRRIEGGVSSLKDYARWPHSTLTSLVRQGEIELQKAGTGARAKILAVRLLEGHNYNPIDASTKTRLLRVLVDHSNSKGTVSVPIRQLSRAIGVSGHDIVKLLFDLKNDGMVDLRTTTNGSQIQISRIRVRPAAQFKYTETGPESEPELETGPEPEMKTETEPEAEPEGAGVSPEEGEVLRSAVNEIDLSRFPLLSELLLRGSLIAKVQAAAEALEAAGLEELAIQAYEALPTYTPLEREIVEFIRERGER